LTESGIMDVEVTVLYRCRQAARIAGSAPPMSGVDKSENNVDVNPGGEQSNRFLSLSPARSAQLMSVDVICSFLARVLGQVNVGDRFG
jgi:hypothetical protein